MRVNFVKLLKALRKMTNDKVLGAMEAAAIREESDIMVKFEKKPKA